MITHIPVLVDEVVSFLEPEDSKVYVDCTIGTGGHTKAILEEVRSGKWEVGSERIKIYGIDRLEKSKIKNQKSKIRIYGIDRDLESLEVARENLKDFKDRIEFIHGNFKDLKSMVMKHGTWNMEQAAGPGQVHLVVDGVLFDLGISSFQLEDGNRGFGYKFDGKLDMRMDKTEGVPCFEVLNGLKEARLGEKEIREIIEDFGEERFAKRIARSIYNALPMKTTFELKDSILKVIPYRKHGKTLSRVFQAFRIKVNDELLNLKQGLESAVEILKSGGRIVCISYHSLEDRIVKWFFKENEHLMVLTKKPIRPNIEEVKINRRARSAKLRAAEKINVK